MKPVFQWVYAPQNQRTAAAPSPSIGSSTSTVGAGISERISQAFDAASDQTGTSFRYLLDTAQRESSLKPEAAASSSSAKGMFQFIESTWLQTMKESGPALGLGDYADAISRDAKGRYVVTDATARKQILDLRSDPEVSSLLAGAYTRQNAAYLKDALGRDATAGELYIAHFLGAKGAGELIRAAATTPDQTASELFPRQAAANRGVFYEKGSALSVSELYAELTSQHGSDIPIGPGDGAVMAAFQTAAAVMPRTVWDPALGYSDSATPRAAAGNDAEAAIAAVADATTSTGTASAEATDAATVPPAAAPASTAAQATAFSSLFRADGASDPAMSAAFWRGFGQAPAMFDVALAEDARTIDGAVGEAERTSAALRASQPGQILDGTRAPFTTGPLDLGKFLKSG